MHPNDDVNRSQSTNDIFPTAIHMCVATAIHKELLPSLQAIEALLHDKAESWSDIVKSRTHLQDAVPITLGQVFSGYATQVRKARQRLESSLDELYELCVGGTAVGTGINAPKGFSERVCALLVKQTGLPFRVADNRFALQGAHDALVAVMMQLKNLAVVIIK